MASRKTVPPPGQSKKRGAPTKKPGGTGVEGAETKHVGPGEVINTDTGKSLRIIDRLMTADWSIYVESSGEAQLYLCFPSEEDEGPYLSYVEAATKAKGKLGAQMPRDSKKPYVIKVYIDPGIVRTDVMSILAEVDSPHIAKIYDTGYIVDGTLMGLSYEISEYYRIGNLKENEFSPDDFLAVARGINEGLRILHQNGLIHRDIKPANILVGDDGITVCLTDFGISAEKLRDKDEYHRTQVVGTPDYVPPEIVFKRLSPRETTDYYSFGITLYELYFGLPPIKKRIADNAKDDSILGVYFPDEPIPENLKLLIQALTFSDGDTAYLDLRWTYDNVMAFCEGVELENPWLVYGSRAVSFRYEFGNEVHRTPESAMLAFARSGRSGMREIFNEVNIVAPAFSGYEAASLITEAYRKSQNEANPQERQYVQAVEFWRLVYTVCKDTEEFYWNGERFEDFRDLVIKLYSRIRDNDTTWETCFKHMIRGGILSHYLEHHARADREMVAKVKNVESGQEADPYALVWKLLHICMPDAEKHGFLWREKHFQGGLGEFAAFLLDELAKDGTQWKANLACILQEKILSYYLSEIAPDLGLFKIVNKEEKEYSLGQERVPGPAQDAAFWRLVYALHDGKPKSLFWAGKYHGSLNNLALWLLSGSDPISKQSLVRGKVISAFLRCTQEEPGIIAEIESIETSYEQSPGSEKLSASFSSEVYAVCWRIAYRLCPGIQGFYWNNIHYPDLKEFGMCMKLMLINDYKFDRMGADRSFPADNEWKQSLFVLARGGILLEYLRYTDADANLRVEVSALIKEYGLESPGSEKQPGYTHEVGLHKLAYTLSNDHTFYYNGTFISGIDSLILYLAEALQKLPEDNKKKGKKKKDEKNNGKKSYDKKNCGVSIDKLYENTLKPFSALTDKLVKRSDGTLSAQFIAWLHYVATPEQIGQFEDALSRVDWT